METLSEVKKTDWVKFLVLGSLLGGVYYSTFSWLVVHDWTREDYTYGWLIPAIIVYLIWDNCRAFVDTPATPAWTGFVLLIAGLLLFWLGELSGEFFTQYFSFSVNLIALCWMLLGWRWRTSSTR